MSTEFILPLLDRASRVRAGFVDARHETAFRLFNGFTEGCPDLSIEIFATTGVFYNYAAIPADGAALVEEALKFVRARFPWLQAGIVKIRNSSTQEERRGKKLFGARLDQKIREKDIWYAIDLTMNQDSSLYLDTRNLRAWAAHSLENKTVLNTFGYTGSLGVAALAGGAKQVFQLDRNPAFLAVAKRSYALNSLAIDESNFLAADFWSEISRLKKSGRRFDCIFVDPPFFAVSSRGVVDQVQHAVRLINKVRPLVNDAGFLIVINNALFVSGSDFFATLQGLCRDSYLKILELIPVPEDITGTAETRINPPITDPSPFNHATKIAILGVQRKRT